MGSIGQRAALVLICVIIAMVPGCKPVKQSGSDAKYTSGFMGASRTSIFKTAGDGSEAGTNNAAAAFAAAHAGGKAPSAGMPETHTAQVDRSWQSSTGFSYPFYNIHVMRKDRQDKVRSAFLCKLRELETANNATKFSWITYDRTGPDGVRKRAEIYPGFYAAASAEDRCFLALLPSWTDFDDQNGYVTLLRGEISKLRLHGFNELPAFITLAGLDTRANMMELAFPTRQEDFDRAKAYFQAAGGQAGNAVGEAATEGQQYWENGEAMNLSAAGRSLAQAAVFAAKGLQAAGEGLFIGAQNIGLVNEVMASGVSGQSLPASIKLVDIMLLDSDKEVIYVFANAAGDSRLSCIGGGRSETNPKIHFRNCIMEFNPGTTWLKHFDYRRGDTDNGESFRNPVYNSGGVDTRTVASMDDEGEGQGGYGTVVPDGSGDGDHSYVSGNFKIPMSSCVWTEKDKADFWNQGIITSCEQMCAPIFFEKGRGYDPPHTMFIFDSCATPPYKGQGSVYIDTYGEEGHARCLEVCGVCGRQNLQLIVDEDPNGADCKNRYPNSGGPR